MRFVILSGLLCVLLAGCGYAGIRSRTPSSDAEPAADAFVRSCERRVPVGRQATRAYWRNSACSSENFNQTWVSYDLARRADGIHVRVGVRLAIASSVAPARADYLFERASACGDFMRAFWKRAGLKLDLTISRVGVRGGESHDILLSDGYGRGDSTHLYFDGFSESASWKGDCLHQCTGGDCPARCEGLRQEELCRTMLHETGHLLGLEDEYPEPDCPDRKVPSERERINSVMYDPFGAVEDLRFYPRHFATVLAPLCSVSDRLHASL
jgi:hypothetical protein